jgi:hypothetical protein
VERERARGAAALAALSEEHAAATVSHSCVCIGSPCLRHCVHDASIGGGGGGSLVGPAHASRLR